MIESQTHSHPAEAKVTAVAVLQQFRCCCRPYAWKAGSCWSWRWGLYYPLEVEQFAPENRPSLLAPQKERILSYNHHFSGGMVNLPQCDLCFWRSNRLQNKVEFPIKTGDSLGSRYTYFFWVGPLPETREVEGNMLSPKKQLWLWSLNEFDFLISLNHVLMPDFFHLKYITSNMLFFQRFRDEDNERIICRNPSRRFAAWKLMTL